MASGEQRDRPPLRNPQLADALQTRDMAAIAFALRHGPTIVPLTRPAAVGVLDESAVWTRRDPATGEVVLLLFSDESRRPATLPPDAALASPSWLRDFLARRQEEIAAVFFDLAGPHPLRAAPADIVAALDA